MNSHINYGLWLIMMCHCRFTDFGKVFTLVEGVDGGERWCVGGGWGDVGTQFPLNFAQLKNVF